MFRWREGENIIQDDALLGGKFDTSVGSPLETEDVSKEIKKESLLSNEDILAVNQYADSIIKELESYIGEDKYFLPPSVPHDRSKRAIAQAVGEIDKFEEGYITPKMREGVKIFFEKIIDFYKKTEKNNGEEVAQQLARFFDDQEFRWSPNITDYLNLSQQVQLSAKATRTPSLQAYIGNRFIQTLNYNFSLLKGYPEKLVEDIMNASPADQIDYLRILQKVAQHGAGNGSWAEGSVNLTEDIAKQIFDTSNHALVKYFSEASLQYIQVERENPTGGVVQFQGDMTQGASAISFEKQKKEILLLEKQLYIPNARKNTKPIRVSSDFVGLVDHAGFPQDLVGYSQQEQDQNNEHTLTLKATPIDGVVLDQKITPYKSDKNADEQILLLQTLHRPQMRFFVEQKLGINLSEISLASQLELLDFMAEVSEEDLERVEKLSKKEGLDVVALYESFFAAANSQDVKLRFNISYQEIIDFAEQVNSNDVNRVTQAFSKAIQQINEVEKEVKEKFAKSGKQVNTSKVIQNIHQKIVSFLKTDIKNLLQSENSQEVSLLLEDEVGDRVAIFCSIFKDLFKGKENVSFEDIKGLDFENEGAKELSQNKKQKQEMLDLAKQNYDSDSEFDQMVLGALNKTLDRTDSTFYLLKRDGETISFLSFIEITPTENEGSLDKKHFYAGGFNVDKKYRGSAIGDIMIANTIEKQAQEGIVHGHVNSNIGLAHRHMEKTGFVITDFVQAGDGIGFEIIYDKDQNKKLKTKDVNNFSDQEIIKLYINKFKDISLDEILKLDTDIFVLQFKTDQDVSHYLSQMEEIKKTGYVGSRYISGDKKSNINYIVFEKINNKQKQEEGAEVLLAA